MTTIRSGLRIPVVTVGLALSAMLGGCSSDSEPTSSSVAAATTVSATDATATDAPTTDAPTTALPATADPPAEPPASSAPATDGSLTDPTVTIATVAPETSVTTITTVPTTSTTGSNVVTISVTAGVDSGEDRIEAVPLGATVTLTVINPDRDDEFHVHGYELGDGIEVPAGQPEVFTFVADQAGEFAVESHTTDVVLLVLSVG